MPLGGYQGRRIEVYLPSTKLKEAIDETSKKRGFRTRCQYILSLIEADFSKDIPRQVPPDLRGKIAELEEEIKRKDMVIQDYRNALARRESLAWIEETDEKRINHRVIEILREFGPIYEARLLTILGIDQRDSNMVQAVSAQLERLEGYGLIKKGAMGWKWL